MYPAESLSIILRKEVLTDRTRDLLLFNHRDSQHASAHSPAAHCTITEHNLILDRTVNGTFLQLFCVFGRLGRYIRIYYTCLMNAYKLIAGLGLKNSG